MKKLFLDISNCALDPRLKSALGGITHIPITPGRHEKDYDVIEEELSKDVVIVLRAILQRGSRDDRPIGTDTRFFPEGAEIKTAK